MYLNEEWLNFFDAAWMLLKFCLSFLWNQKIFVCTISVKKNLNFRIRFSEPNRVKQFAIVFYFQVKSFVEILIIVIKPHK